MFYSQCIDRQTARGDALVAVEAGIGRSSGNSHSEFEFELDGSIIPGLNCRVNITRVKFGRVASLTGVSALPGVLVPKLNFPPVLIWSCCRPGDGLRPLQGGQPAFGSRCVRDSRKCDLNGGNVSAGIRHQAASSFCRHDKSYSRIRYGAIFAPFNGGRLFHATLRASESQLRQVKVK